MTVWTLKCAKRRAFAALAFVALTPAIASAQFFTPVWPAGVDRDWTATDSAGFETWNKLRDDFDAGNDWFKRGTGSPEGVVTAAVGAWYINTSGSTCTTHYRKESGSGNTGWSATCNGTTTGASTDTFTNKTLDAEASGNAITIPLKEWWPAAVQTAAGASLLWDHASASDPAPTAFTGSNVLSAVADFDDSATESMQRHFLLPSDWTGTLDLSIAWRTTATTGNVVWQVQTGCAANNEADDPSWNTAQEITDAAQGTGGRLNFATQVTLTTTGCAAGELLHLRITRDPAHASDTIAATASMVGAQLTYRRTL